MPRQPSQATGAVVAALHLLLLLAVFLLGECNPGRDDGFEPCDPNPPYTTC